MVEEGRIEPQLAMKVVGCFDRIVTEVLADKVKARLSFKVTIPRTRLMGEFLWGMELTVWFTKGHLDTYRFCDEVWTFLIKDVNFKLDNQSQVHADKVKIVSCNSKKPGEA